MNQILFEVNWIGSLRSFFSEMVLCVLFSVGLVRQIRARNKMDRSKTRGQIKYITETASIISWGIITAVLIVAVCNGYFDIIVAYKLGNYCEVEGMVEDFRIREGCYDLYFVIEDVAFSPGQTASWGYTLLMTNKSVIQGNGQHLKIRYIPYGGDNAIVYIEQIE
ncbi:MAG: hypothetical protein J6K48_05825 [Lachnospiraceae bacterium]|nr:hypothetical protein [Lachnospiraceae bacterium]